jgi:hypothetical protein
MVAREDVHRIATPTAGLHARKSVDRAHSSDHSRNSLQAARDGQEKDQSMG